MRESVHGSLCFQQSCVSQGTDPIGSMGFSADSYDTHGIMYLETYEDKPFCLDW